MSVDKVFSRRLFKSLVVLLLSVLVLSACDYLFPPPEPETCESNPSAETCFPNTPEPGAADFSLSNSVSSAEAEVGDTITFTFRVKNIGEKAGEATLTTRPDSGFDAEPLDVSLSLEPDEVSEQSLTGTVLETAGETLAIVATLSGSAAGNVSEPAQVSVIKDETPPPPPRTTQGAVILTFDDNFTENWLTADEKLAAYDWKATFFITGGEDAVPSRGSALRELQEKGHEIGAHTITHTSVAAFLDTGGTVEEYYEQDVVPNLELLEEEELEISSFAYANGATTPAFDDILLERFTNLRGIAPTSANAAGGRFYVTEPGELPGLSIDERSSRGTLGTTEIDYILEALAAAKDKDEALVMYAHDIVDGTVDDINGLGLTLDRLEQIVTYVDENNMEFLTMSDLDGWQD